MALEAVQAQAGGTSIESRRILHLADDWVAAQYRKAAEAIDAQVFAGNLAGPGAPAGSRGDRAGPAGANGMGLPPGGASWSPHSRKSRPRCTAT